MAVSVLMLIILIFVVHDRLSASRSIDLSGLLSAFSECNVNVMSVGLGLTAEPLLFPISLSTYPYRYRILNFDLDHMEFGAGVAKRVFCAVQVFLVDDTAALTTTAAIGPRARTQFFPNPFCSIRRRWTNCIAFVVGLTRSEWRDFLVKEPAFWSAQLTPYEITSGMLTTQFFLVYDSLYGDEMDYAARQIGNNSIGAKTSILVSVKRMPGERLPDILERTVNDVRHGGRALAFPLSSYLDGIMTTYLSLAKLSLYEYYMVYRHHTTFARVLFAILLEETPLQVLYPHREVETRSISLDPPWFNHRGKRLHLASKESFNFLTCHGLQNSAPITAYVTPFDTPCWITLIVALILLWVILVATLLLLAPTTHAPTNRIVGFSFYVVANLMENNFGSENPIPSRVTSRFVFTLIALACIILGCLYKGVLTRDIIVPLPSRIPYAHIAELDNFELFVLPTEVSRSGGFIEIENAEESRCDWNRSDHEKVLLLSTSGFGRELAGWVAYEPDMVTQFYSRLTFRTSPRSTAQDLVQCGDKRALVGLQKELAWFLGQYGMRERLGAGMDTFLPFFHYWHIPLAAGGYLDRRMSALLTSGLASIWETVYWNEGRVEQIQRATRAEYQLGCALQATLARTCTRLLSILHRNDSFGLPVCQDQ